MNVMIVNKIEVPAFADLVTSEIARYIEAKSDELLGDEDVHFILNEIRDELENGMWRHFLPRD